jgi:polyisoprenyl-teichoic acid--peptidoglycan teichoic acid transferase
MFAPPAGDADPSGMVPCSKRGNDPAPERETRVAGRPQHTSLAGVPAGLGRAVAAGSLSLVVPGLGQLLLGARRRGQAMLGVTGLLLLVVVWQRSRGAASMLELLVQPRAVAAILVGNAALAFFHLYATLDAFRSGLGGVAPPSTDRRATLGTAGLLVSLSIAAAAPHVLAAHYALVLDETLGSVFAERQVASTDEVQELPGDGDPTGVELDPGRWLEKDRLSIAVLGSDAHPKRPGARIDALLVVSVDPGAGEVTVFSVERHLRDFPLPARLVEPWETHCKELARGWEYLNAVYRCGDEVLGDEVARMYPNAPDPAAAAMAGALGELLDLRIDHYVMVDMRGFVELVEALGGVRLDLDEPVRDGCDWRGFDVQPSGPELGGWEVLELVRSRTGTGGADRMARQRCFLALMAREVDVSSLLWRFGSLAGVVRDHVDTSIPTDELPQLIALLGHLDRDQIETVGFERPGHVSSEGRPHVDRIRATVQHTLERRPPPARPGAAQ